MSSSRLNMSLYSTQWTVGAPDNDDTESRRQENHMPMLDETEDGTLQMMDPTSNSTWIRAAIPHLPRWLASILLLFNIGLPGSGTILSGWTALCLGKPRMNNVGLMVCINTSVGLAQFFTIPWMLVGWIWSIVWGVFLVILAESPSNDRSSSSDLSEKLSECDSNCRRSSSILSIVTGASEDDAYWDTRTVYIT